MSVVNELASSTGRKIMYAFNISDQLDQMLKHHDTVLAAGGTCVMISLNSVGFAGVEYLSQRFALPIHGHRNGWGMYSRHPALGMEFTAYQKLWRLGGCRSAARQRTEKQILRVRRFGRAIDQGLPDAHVRRPSDNAGRVVGPMGWPGRGDISTNPDARRHVSRRRRHPRASGRCGGRALQQFGRHGMRLRRASPWRRMRATTSNCVRQWISSGGWLTRGDDIRNSTHRLAFDLLRRRFHGLHRCVGSAPQRRRRSRTVRKAAR